MILYWPIDKPSKSVPTGYKYGASRGNVTHLGVDLGGPAMGGAEGDAVYAAAAGVVRVVKDFGAAGGVGIYVKHDDTYETRYYHLQAGSPAVKVGDHVKANDRIAALGRTGIVSSPAHLHFEVRKGAGTVDPLPLLTDSPVRSSGGNWLLMAAVVGLVWWWKR